MKRISKWDIAMGLTNPEVREIVIVGLMTLMPKAIAVVVWGCRSKRKSQYGDKKSLWLLRTGAIEDGIQINETSRHFGEGRF